MVQMRVAKVKMVEKRMHQRKVEQMEMGLMRMAQKKSVSIYVGQESVAVGVVLASPSSYSFGIRPSHEGPWEFRIRIYSRLMD
jgi:TPP-dependent pyruvate/acetoin dehydrogenase alpha subunit